MSCDNSTMLLCGRCRVVVTSSIEGPVRFVCCPVCGESDTAENARREAGRHTAHQLLQLMLRAHLRKGPALHFRFVEEIDALKDR
jgi:NMD protein affecting ribosome stability and mRNA decay